MKPKKKNKKLFIIIAVVIIIFLAIRIVSCAFAGEQGALVTTTNAQRGDLQENVSTSGTVVSGEVTVIFSEINARVSDVSVEAGDAVHAGDTLVSFDMEQMERTLSQARLQQTKSNAGYQGAITDNSKTQTELAEATINLDVLNKQIADYKSYLKSLQEKLKQSQRDTGNDLAEDAYHLNNKLSELQTRLEEGTVSGGDAPGSTLSSEERNSIYEQINEVKAQISRNSYLQSIANSSDYVAEMEAEIADVQEKLADCEADKARMESQKDVSEGAVWNNWDRESYTADYELAQLSYDEAQEAYYKAKKGIDAEYDGIVTECSVIAGATVTEGVQLLTLESSENIKVSFQASKYDVEKLEVGQKVDVTIFDKVYEGEISKVNRMARANASNTPMVGVEVQILNPDDKIILGLDAKLVIHTREAKDALMVPLEAVNADRNGDFLYVVENGRVVKKPVVCGITTDSYTEVKEGITEQDEIIVTSYTTIEEGMAVTAMPETAVTGTVAP